MDLYRSLTPVKYQLLSTLEVFGISQTFVEELHPHHCFFKIVHYSRVNLILDTHFAEFKFLKFTLMSVMVRVCHNVLLVTAHPDCLITICILLYVHSFSG